MGLNTAIGTARNDRAAGFNKANVTFDMLSEELRLCVGGVLANVSTDNDNRTRIYQLELKLASEGVQAAKVGRCRLTLRKPC